MQAQSLAHNEITHPEKNAVTRCTRERLLQIALQLFAEKRFANTSIRDLARQASVNVSAIRYYFKDKVGLYRAVYNNKLWSVGAQDNYFGYSYNEDGVGLWDFLRVLIRTYMEPLKQGDVAAWCIRLHMREMLEPTGLWEDEISQEIAPAQLALQMRLCQELGLTSPDDRVRRLAISIVGLSVHVLVSRDVVNGIAPHLLEKDAHIDAYADQLLEYAMAMVAIEKQRVLLAGAPQSSQSQL